MKTIFMADEEFKVVMNYILVDCTRWKFVSLNLIKCKKYNHHSNLTEDELCQKISDEFAIWFRKEVNLIEL